MGSIVWLASYPKSGNTWLRIFLANLLSRTETPVDINRFSIGGQLNLQSNNRFQFDSLMGVESSDLLPSEIDELLPCYYRKLAELSPDPLYIKIHDLFRYTINGEALIPAGIGKSVYLVRNPLDVAVSFAHHRGESVDRTIVAMADTGCRLCASRDRLHEDLEHPLSAWSRHVISWLDQTCIPVHLMRYEDMLRHPMVTFGRCLEFLGIEAGIKQIERALCFSSFEELSAQESAFGFRERPWPGVFFRKGREGDWRQSLTEPQRDRVVKDQWAVMRRLGYISADGPDEYACPQ